MDTAAHPAAERAAVTGTSSRPHVHFWTLPDGTGLHAPIGHLLRDGDARLCCHLCGRWFAALGPHLRVHGYTADAYREAMGLGVTTPLVAATLSQRLSRRRAMAYHAHDEVRERLAPGQEMARDGRLTSRARATLDRGPEPPERVRLRTSALDAGRATRARRRSAALNEHLRSAGAESLADYLRPEYAGGASLATLARSTGLGRARLRVALDEAGVVLRASGQNTPQGRTSRALLSTAEAEARVGTTDLHAWLAQQRAAGWSTSRLARATGRSPGWVRARLDP